MAGKPVAIALLHLQQTQFVIFTQHFLSKLAQTVGASCLFSDKSLLECHCNIPGTKNQFVKSTHKSINSREPHQHFNQSRAKNSSCPHSQDYQGYCNIFILIYSAIKYLPGLTEDQNAF